MTMATIEGRRTLVLPRLGFGTGWVQVLCLAVVMLSIGVWVAGYLQWLARHDHLSADLLILARAVQARDQAFAFSTIVVAPALEELVFRYAVFEMFGRRRILLPLVISVLTFTALHPSLAGAPTALLTGIVLGGTYIRYRSVGLCMALHALWNCQPWLAGLVLEFRIPGYWSVLAGREETISPWLLGASLVLVPSALWVLIRRAHEGE